jgi:hypothetical protein
VHSFSILGSDDGSINVINNRRILYRRFSAEQSMVRLRQGCVYNNHLKPGTDHDFAGTLGMGTVRDGAGKWPAARLPLQTSKERPFGASIPATAKSTLRDDRSVHQLIARMMRCAFFNSSEHLLFE